MNQLLITTWGLIVCGNVWIAAGKSVGLAFLAMACVSALAGLAVSHGGIWTRDLRWWKK